MTAHPHDASDPSSADGPAVDAPPSHVADQEYLLRDRPPPRTADDIAALTADRDDARAALYRAQGAMLRMRDRCAELRAEVGATFKKLCDAATLAGVRERERDEARAEVGALTKERDALKAELATVTKGRDAAALMFEDSAVWAENAERDARSLRAAVERWQGWMNHRGNVGPLAAKYRAVGLSQVEQDLVDAACAFDREMGKEVNGDS